MATYDDYGFADVWHPVAWEPWYRRFVRFLWRGKA